MFDIAADLLAWAAAGREVRLARVLAAGGLAGREAAPVAAWAVGGDEAVGSPLAARARAVLGDAGTGVVEVSLSDDQAEGVGLACGGSATVLVQALADLPAALLELVGRGEPVALVDAPDGSTPTAVHGPGDVPTRFARVFGRGTSAVVVFEARTDGDAAVVLTTYWPRTRVLVVGGGPVAAALTAQAELLGWELTVVDGPDEPAAAVRDLGRADAVVVLSHDRAVDGPALAAAVASPVGYVGAMGSRHTQAARAQWFAEHGVIDRLDRIHGPAGLDIGGFGPAEIALSIAAEIVAGRSGAVAG